MAALPDATSCDAHRVNFSLTQPTASVAPNELTKTFALPIGRHLLNFVLPSRCALCKQPGDVLCWTCFGRWQLRPHSTTRGDQSKPLAGLAAADYQAPLDGLLRDFKDGGCASLDVFFATVMARQMQASILANRMQELVLVPMPSSNANYAKRGFVPAELLAIRLAQALAPTNKVKVLSGVRRVSEGHDQSQLDQQQRGDNQRQAMRASQSLEGLGVWLVDDIVTTGSTLLEAKRAVEAVGARVEGFAVFAETLLKRDARNLKWV